MSTQSATALPIGRFAPSPTGRLHLGSLLTAVASFCHIKAQGGQWLLRIEDTDFERCKPDFTTAILTDLEKLGLCWDGQVVYQSARIGLYNELLESLDTHCYACDCSRKSLGDVVVYPRICLDKSLPHSEKIRLILPDIFYGFVDEYQGVQWQNPQKTLGDVVIKRQNGMINYMLACAVDDGLAGVTSLVRGLDILPMTTAQLYIQRLLGLPTPSHFAHLPLLVNNTGQKLSKQTLATPIDTTQPHKAVLLALNLLKMPIPSELNDEKVGDILKFAIQNWQGEWQKNGLIGKQIIQVA